MDATGVQYDVQLKGQIDKGGHYDVQMKGWMQRIHKLKGWMDKGAHYVKI